METNRERKGIEAKEGGEMRENKECLTRIDWLEKIDEKIEKLENRLEKLEDWVSFLKYTTGSFLRTIDRKD